MKELLSNFNFLFFLILLWVLPWKGWALWRAARNNHKNWFIVLFLLNTLAILDILYIFVFGKNKENEKENNLPEKLEEKNNDSFKEKNLNNEQ